MSRAARAHLVVLLAYVALTPVAVFVGWTESVTFVSLLSVWALVESRWATFAAARTKDALEQHEEEA